MIHSCLVDDMRAQISERAAGAAFTKAPEAVSEVVEQALNRIERESGRRGRSGIDRARAERMVADLGDYDSKIQGGRLTDG